MGNLWTEEETEILAFLMMCPNNTDKIIALTLLRNEGDIQLRYMLYPELMFTRDHWRRWCERHRAEKQGAYTAIANHFEAAARVIVQGEEARGALFRNVLDFEAQDSTMPQPDPMVERESEESTKWIPHPDCPHLGV